MERTQHWLLTFLLMFSLIGATHANEEESKNELGLTIKEIFVKGSINDDKLFMVLGLEDGAKIFKNIGKEAIDLEELKDIGADTARSVGRTARRIYNGGNGDVLDHVTEAARFSVENPSDIYKSPWRSLSKIPTSYKVSMEQARDARANSSNSAAGLVKYTGLATWAHVKGAYYLVVEAPAKLVGQLAARALAVPAVLAYDAISIPLGFTISMAGKALRVGYQATKAIVLGAAAIGTISYSAISTSLAAVATTTSYLAIGAVKITIKALALPFRIGQRARLKTETEVNYEKLTQLGEEFAKNSPLTILEELGLSTEYTVSKIQDYKGTITFGSKLAKKFGMKLKLSIKWNTDKSKQNTVVTSYFSKKHFNALMKKTGLNKKQLKEVLLSKVTDLVAKVATGVSNE
ncbi:MAG: hypothetical protein GY909_09925 [Oligoflexia bacterium]|nr:hypothetical protein [Oligoflexia bacterium]